MSTQFEQIRIQHYMLLESLFDNSEDSFDSDVVNLLRKINEADAENVSVEKIAYVNEVKIFWTDYYKELCNDTKVDRENMYRRFRKTGGKLQGHGYYDLAVDLLEIATNRLEIFQLTIHREILRKWKRLAEDMRELRSSFSVAASSGQTEPEAVLAWVESTRARLSRAQRSLKNVSSVDNNKEIGDAIRVLAKVSKDFERDVRTKSILTELDIKKIRNTIKDGNAFLILGDFVQNKKVVVNGSQTVFDQRGQTIGSQTNIHGDVSGPVFSGTFVAPVALNQRNINTGGGDYVDGSKSISSNPEDKNHTPENIVPVSEVVTDDLHKTKDLVEFISRKYFGLSVAHPKQLSKRYESAFVVHFFFNELDYKVKLDIETIIGAQSEQHIFGTRIGYGQTIKVKCYSPDIKFSDSVIKEVDSAVNKVLFLAKPAESCSPGKHQVTVSILESKTDLVIQSEIFNVHVTDYAFYHVSYPFLSKIGSVIVGIGSLAMFILSFFEQLDKTFGLTSGTAAGIAAVAMYANFYNVYRRISPDK